VSYTYTIETDNKNDRTLGMFSTHANDKMRPCAKCELYNDFNRLSGFYGKLDFADQWIKAALTGTRVVFDSSTADFVTMPTEVRAGMYTCTTGHCAKVFFIVGVSCHPLFFS
jgi:hypothetical protein